MQSRWPAAIVIALALVAAAAAVFVVLDFQRDSVRVQDPGDAVPYTPAPKKTPAPAKLNLPAHPDVVAFGDSWASGYAAKVSTNGFLYLTARELGWNLTVARGGSGTGYVVGTPKGYEYPNPRYAARIRQQPADRGVDLVILQGSLNDIREGDPGLRFNQAVEDAVDAAKARYPNAELLIVGPVAPSPIITAQIASLDSRLTFETQRLRLNYISGTAEGWLGSQALIDRYIAQNLENHPDTRGHAYLAGKLTAAIRKVLR